MDKSHIRGRTPIYCPVCRRGKIIMEEGDSDDIQLALVAPEDRGKVRWYIKCGVCKSQIGISVK